MAVEYAKKTWFTFYLSGYPGCCGAYVGSSFANQSKAPTAAVLKQYYRGKLSEWLLGAGAQEKNIVKASNVIRGICKAVLAHGNYNLFTFADEASKQLGKHIKHTGKVQVRTYRLNDKTTAKVIISPTGINPVHGSRCFVMTIVLDRNNPRKKKTENGDKSKS
jgi:hypothetical protein